MLSSLDSNLHYKGFITSSINLSKSSLISVSSLPIGVTITNFVIIINYQINYLHTFIVNYKKFSFNNREEE